MIYQTHVQHILPLLQFKIKKDTICYTVGTIPKYNCRIVETETKWILLTHIYDHSLSWPDKTKQS